MTRAKGVMANSRTDYLSVLYLHWMERMICREPYTRGKTWHQLLRCLFSMEFVANHYMDANRGVDGIDLRYRFANTRGTFAVPIENEPCTVLEMMVALSLRCEEHIMNNPEDGDRTGKWFFEMIASLGLDGMDDQHFNRETVKRTVSSFLSADYSPDGRGGLFYIPGCPKDLRTMEIWYQLMWYLNTIV